jgi:hypothetical protein
VRLLSFLIVIYSVDHVLCSVANATADLIMIGAWYCVMSTVDAEAIPVSECCLINFPRDSWRDIDLLLCSR